MTDRNPAILDLSEKNEVEFTPQTEEAEEVGGPTQKEPSEEDNSPEEEEEEYSESGELESEEEETESTSQGQEAEEDLVEPKISLIEIIFVGQLVIFADIALAILNLFVITAPVASAISFFVSSLLSFYYWFKGVRWRVGLVGAAVEVVPLLNTLPAYTLTFIAIVVIDRNEKARKAVEGASALKGKIK